MPRLLDPRCGFHCPRPTEPGLRSAVGPGLPAAVWLPPAAVRAAPEAVAARQGPAPAGRPDLAAAAAAAMTMAVAASHQNHRGAKTVGLTPPTWLPPLVHQLETLRRTEWWRLEGPQGALRSLMVAAVLAGARQGGGCLQACEHHCSGASECSTASAGCCCPQQLAAFWIACLRPMRTDRR